MCCSLSEEFTITPDATVCCRRFLSEIVSEKSARSCGKSLFQQARREQRMIRVCQGSKRLPTTASFATFQLWLEFSKIGREQRRTGNLKSLASGATANFIVRCDKVYLRLRWYAAPNRPRETWSMAVARALNLERELLEAFEHCYRATDYLLQILPAPIWSAKPPGENGRSIAAIVAHMQSVRNMFAKIGGADPLPVSLDRSRSTLDEARPALQQSREALTKLFEAALGQGQARVKKMPRRLVNMMSYLMQHDAHHRGQICSLARVLGFRMSKEDVMRLWGWKSLPPDK